MMMREVDALREREKELRCLYRIQQLTFDSALSLECVFEQVVEAIPPGWQSPETTGACIEYFAKRYTGTGYQPAAPRLTEPLYLGEQKIGAISVSDSDTKPFLPEEGDLLASISRMLSSFLEWRHLEVLGKRLSSVKDSHWQWRERLVRSMVEHYDSAAFGSAEFYLGGSTQRGEAGHGSDIDLQILHKGNPNQRQHLRNWLHGWSLSIAEMIKMQTGEVFADGILNLKWLNAKPDLLRFPQLQRLGESGPGNSSDSPDSNLGDLETGQAEAMVQRTLLGLSHEIRNPLTAVSMNLDLLSKELSPETRTEIATEAERAIARISSLVADLMLFLRAETGLEKPQMEEVELSNFLRQLVQRLREQDHRNQIVSYREFSGGDRRVRLSRKVTSRIVSDLVKNAVRYSRCEAISVAISDGPSNTVSISVKDDGCGIDEVYHDKLFEQFYRLEASRDRETGGAGLGLPLARALARCQNSDLEFFSRPGEGTEVRLVFQKG